MTAEKLSIPEALIYAMITVSAVDRKISDAELSRIGSMVRDLPVFTEYTDDWLVGTAQDCGKVLSKAGGLDRVLDMVKASLPKPLHETVYLLCAEVAATDLALTEEEVRFLQLLAGKLGLDKLLTAALQRAARARYQKA